MEMKWFNLPGAKEAFIRNKKLLFFNDPNLEVPWTNFCPKTATSWEIFTLAFPDQAWTLQQIFLIDKNIDETLNSLERWLPSSYKPKSWTETNESKDSLEYYQNTGAMIRQRELILHFVEVLAYRPYDDESATDQLRLNTFRDLCRELVETACLNERAKLIRQLLSPKQTAPLLSSPARSQAFIWDVRREAMRRGSMLQKTMQKMRETLGLREEDYEAGQDEEETQDASSNAEQPVEEPQEQYDNLQPEIFECVDDKCRGCTGKRRANTDEYASSGTEVGGSGTSLPVRERPDSRTIATAKADQGEGEWTSVIDENEEGDY